MRCTIGELLFDLSLNCGFPVSDLKLLSVSCTFYNLIRTFISVSGYEDVE